MLYSRGASVTLVVKHGLQAVHVLGTEEMG